MNQQGDVNQTTTVIGDILHHLSNLVRKEVDLARSEVSQNLNQAAVAIGLLVAAVVIALTALNVLSAAVVAGLVELGLDAGWASLIVGGLLGLIALAFVLKGVNDLKLSSIAPTRTAENLKRDAQAVKGAFDD